MPLNRFDIQSHAGHRAPAMPTRAISIALVTLTLIVAPNAAMSRLYRWVDDAGSVHYGDTPPKRAKNVRPVGNDSGSVSVVPALPKEQIARLREREDEQRLQRLEREVEELRARELARANAQPEVIYTDVYVPAYAYGRPLHRRPVDHGKRRPEPPIAKPRPPDRTLPAEELSARTPPGGLLRR